MRRPVVFRPQPDIARLVFFLVIEAKRIAASLSRFFDEPAVGKDMGGRILDWGVENQ
jgi:hypothetical protein